MNNNLENITSTDENNVFSNNENVLADAVSVEQSQSLTSELANVETSNKNNRKVWLIVAIIILLLLSGGVWYAKENNLFFFANKRNNRRRNEDRVLLPKLAGMHALNDISDFDFAILKQYNNGESIVYSPLSLKYTLGMLSEGANGETKKQIDNIIGDYNFSKIYNSKNISLDNTMFIRNGFKVNDSYVKSIAKKFNANIFKDDFQSAVKMNEFIKNNTFDLIDDGVDESKLSDYDYILSNMLGIDLKWNFKIQNGIDDVDTVDGRLYRVTYNHEYYTDYLDDFDVQQSSGDFNGKKSLMAEVKVSANKYDVVKELGAENIKETVKNAYFKEFGDYSLDEVKSSWDCNSTDECLENYIKSIDENYGSLESSTDFYFYKDSDVTVFAKDLRETDNTNIQYIGIMPNNTNLDKYIQKFDAREASRIISNLKNADDINSYKDGVLTHIDGKIPMFNVNYNMDLTDLLISMGVVNVFDDEKADLSKIAAGSFAVDVQQNSKIEFTNNGITAAAFTYAGGVGDAEGWDYKYDVPVEEIDLTFDKPFMYIIRNKDTNEVWFAGTVYEATKIMSEEEYQAQMHIIFPE